MKPIGKYIVVDDIKEEVKTDSGLIMSGEDLDQMRYRRAKVVAVGTTVDAIKRSDVVYYDKGRSFTMVIQDVPRTIISEGDVVVVE